MCRSSLILIFLFVESFCIAQKDSTYYYFDRTTPVTSIESRIKRSKNAIDKQYFSLVYHSKLRNTDSINIFLKEIEKSEILSSNLIPRFNYLKAYYYRIVDNDSLAYKFHHEALSSAFRIKDTLTILNALTGLAQSWDYNEENHYRLDYLNELEKASNTFDNNSFRIIHKLLKANYYLYRDNNNEAIKEYIKLTQSNFESRDSVILLNAYNNIGALYQENIGNSDSAIYYYRKKLDILASNKKFGFTKNYFDVYNNIARSYVSKKDYSNAKKYFKKADSLEKSENLLSSKLLINKNLAEVNEAIKNYEEGYYNLKNVIKLSDSLKEKEHQEKIADIIEKYDNEQLKSDIKQKETQQRNLWIGSSILIIILGIISFLIYKNTKRKQRIAEQEKALEIQKKEKLLKDQELNAIDAMIAGQEKERERLASDLHDSVGATLSAAKLQFDHLSQNKDKLEDLEEIFQKTGSLLDEAYTEVRAMAHLKNSGVIAKKGLLPAVKNLAKNASNTGGLTIEVQDFGLDGKLDGSLEITIFRVIQELITNIIKHAEASEANISITQHKEVLSIIVEDNGKGFNTRAINKNEGMGLANIEKRIEHLEGSLEVDSTPKKGTSILIDIPI